MAVVVKNSTASAGDIRDMGSIPGSGKSAGGRHGNPLQYSCLENLMDRRTCQAMIHKVAKSRVQLKQLSMHTHTHTEIRIPQSSLVYVNVYFFRNI